MKRWFSISNVHRNIANMDCTQKEGASGNQLHEMKCNVSDSSKANVIFFIKKIIKKHSWGAKDKLVH